MPTVTSWGCSSFRRRSDPLLQILAGVHHPCGMRNKAGGELRGLVRRPRVDPVLAQALHLPRRGRDDLGPPPSRSAGRWSRGRPPGTRTARRDPAPPTAGPGVTAGAVSRWCASTSAVIRSVWSRASEHREHLVLEVGKGGIPAQLDSEAPGSSTTAARCTQACSWSWGAETSGPFAILVLAYSSSQPVLAVSMHESLPSPPSSTFSPWSSSMVSSPWSPYSSSSPWSPSSWSSP